MRRRTQRIGLQRDRLPVYLFVITPLLLVLAVGIYVFITQNVIPSPGLKWNDEAAYYTLIKTYAIKFWPRGYWGFDGNHAIIGTGSAWNPAILFPYVIFAYLFNWGYSGVFWANLFYMVFGNFMFLYYTEPKKEQIFRLIAVQATSTILILYMSTNMSEPLRFSMAIVLAGMLYKLFFGQNSNFFKYIFAPLFILYTIQVYTFFAFCIPLYVFAVLKEQSLVKKLLASAAAMLVGALGSYYVLHLISSNYNIYKTEALLNSIKSFQVFGAIKAFIGMFKEGVYGVLGILEPYWGNALFLWYLPFCLILLAGAIVLLILNLQHKEKKVRGTNVVKNEEEMTAVNHDKTIAIVVVYSMLMFFFMYMTVYSIERFTFLRGTAIVIMFSLHLMMLSNKKWVSRALILAWAVGLIALPMNLQEFTRDRYISNSEKTEWEQLDQELFSLLKIQSTDDPWDNTIALFTMEPKVVAAIPTGFGVNMIINEDAFPTNARYLLFSTEESKEELNSEWLEKYYPDIYEENRELLDNVYSVIYEDHGYIVYVRKH